MRAISYNISPPTLMPENRTQLSSSPTQGQIDQMVEVFIHPNGWKYYRRGNTISDFSSFQVRADIHGDDYDIAQIGEGHSHSLFVDHKARLASKDEGEIWGSVDPFEPEKMHKLKIAYWEFMCKYPCHRQLPNGSFEAAQQLLHCYVMDGLRRRTETKAPFSLEQSKELLSYMNEHAKDETERLESTFDIPSQSHALTALISWIFMTSAKHREIHSYGLRTKQDALSPPKSPGVFFRLSSILCFGVPRSHLRRITEALEFMRLQKRVDAWDECLKLLAEEMAMCVLGATVLLASSISLLTIPGMTTSNLAVALLSVVFTLGSMMTGIYMQWQTYKVNFEDENIVKQATVLAVLFSIPAALLIWATLLFTGAVIMYALLALQSGSGSVEFRHQTSLAVLVPCVVFALVMGTVVVYFRGLRARHEKYQIEELEKGP
ncbi:hypothetical protein JAAARDRAFT_62511 [Jaapia argillacea MUCL 33604]|uniref:Uncharacterized protein n=1 Tax=Jaapia argillacea MUCL 33604 TaxID=933084 RepID=A0A067PKE0_9AGAM|nr:hypothetical protein JAAARDRAFT_62511 [Jaapia argillacea MUCL 33604]